MHSIKVIGQWGAERIINNKSEQTPRWPTNKIKNNNNKKQDERQKTGEGGKSPVEIREESLSNRNLYEMLFLLLPLTIIVVYSLAFHTHTWAHTLA